MSKLDIIKKNQERNLELHKNRLYNEETTPEFLKDHSISKEHPNPRLEMANGGLALEERDLELGSASFIENSNTPFLKKYKKADVQEANLGEANVTEKIIENNTSDESEPATMIGAEHGSDLPTENVLHDFEPVNYIITLSCLAKQTFNSSIGPEVEIFRSGGKSKQGAGPLSKDYYIDSLVTRCALSPNSTSGMGSYFQILFNVTEPYGVSFIDALIQASRSQGYTDHLAAVYNLRIEFKGYDDKQEATNNIKFSTRDIPIIITAVDMNIEAGVTTYSCQAFPATALGKTDLHNFTQTAVTCSGDTVGEVIDSFLTNYTKELASLSAKTNQKIAPGKTDIFALDIESSKEKILNSKINYTAKSTLERNYTVSNLDPVNIDQDFGFRREITVPKGTSILQFIEEIVAESRFYRDQFVDGRPKTLKLETLRTETQLTIGEDNGNGRDQYTFTFILLNQVVTADVYDGSADTSGLITPARTYDYIHTGKNRDVLDFNIKYNIAYYEAKAYKQDDGQESNTNAAGDGDGDGDANDKDKTNKNSITSFPYEVLNQGEESGLIPGLNDDNGQIVNIFTQIMKNPGADLITTSLEILGDPFWMPQTTVSNQSLANNYTGRMNTDINGAIITHESQPIFQINFKQPVDLNDETGLFDKLQDVHGFKGLYRAIVAEHRFEAGVYTCVLDAVRIKNQDAVESEPKVDSKLTNDNIIKKKDIPAPGKKDQIYIEDLEPLEGVEQYDGNYYFGYQIGDQTMNNVVKQPVNTKIENNTSFLRNQLNATQQTAFDNLMSPTAQVHPLTAQEAYDFVLKTDVGVYVDPAKRLEERYGGSRLSPGALGGAQ